MYSFFVLFRVPHLLSKCVKMGSRNDENWDNQISKTMHMNFISIQKKHEMEIWLLSYVQVGESPTHLNIPTPTPAPDWP